MRVIEKEVSNLDLVIVTIFLFFGALCTKSKAHRSLVTLLYLSSLIFSLRNTTFILFYGPQAQSVTFQFSEKFCSFRPVFYRREKNQIVWEILSLPSFADFFASLRQSVCNPPCQTGRSSPHVFPF